MRSNVLDARAEVHKVEEKPGQIVLIEPSNHLLVAATNRMTQPQPVAFLLVSLVGMLRSERDVAGGALILASAYLVPGRSVVALEPLAVGSIPSPGRALRASSCSISWAISLAGFAALLILMGLALPDASGPGEESFSLEFCILSECKAYKLRDRPFGD